MEDDWACAGVCGVWWVEAIMPKDSKKHQTSLRDVGAAVFGFEVSCGRTSKLNDLHFNFIQHAGRQASSPFRPLLEFLGNYLPPLYNHI